MLPGQNHNRSANGEIARRAEAIFQEQLAAVQFWTNRLFARILVGQWVFGLIVAFWVSPLTWAGGTSSIHPHVWVAVVLGGLLTSLPLYFIFVFPRLALTRHIVAATQILWSALLIHLTGGRIETHFHVFGSLAFLAFYRDWRVLVTATAIVVVDHFVRGLYLPQSVYGVLTAAPWRTLEHGGWVVFEDAFLLISIRQGLREMGQIADDQARLEHSHELIEAEVAERTRELRIVNDSLGLEINDRKKAERRLLAQYATTRILGESKSLAEAAPRLLQAVAESMQWEGGVFWKLDPQARELRCFEVWQSPAAKRPVPEEAVRKGAYACGVGRPGRVWAAAEPVWVPSIDGQTQGEPAGAPGSIGFPIALANEVVGVVEFFGRDMKEPDADLLKMAAIIGSQIGQFIDRRRAAALLQKEQEFLQAVLDNIVEGIVACDEHGTLTLFNRATQALHRSPQEPLTPDRWAEHYDLYRPDGKTRLNKEEVPLFQALQGRQVRDVELVIAPRNGPPRTVLASGQALVNSSGKKQGAVVVLHDITERRRLEEQYRQSQKMESIGHLAGGVAHDFNNLLTIICGYCEVLLNQVRPDDFSFPCISEIKAAADRASSLTRQLLAFSRQQMFQLQVLDLNEIVRGTEKMLGRLIGEDISLTAMLDLRLDPVKADPGQIEQVLMNLAVNAKDAMPRGGKLTIETSNVELDEGYAASNVDVRPGRHVLLAVSDTGHGMTDEVKARIFEPFFTTKDQGKGTGLGLATVFGIVKQSGGHISVYSEVGTGTSFKVYLPALARESLTDQTGTGTAQTPKGTETLLLVEDEEKVRALTRTALQASGYTLLEASNGVEAIRLYEEYPGRVDMLVTDVVMPEMGGRQLAERLMSVRPDLKVLYLSGYTSDAVVRHGVLESEVAFLQKPFSVAGLAKKIREVLDQ
jgi:PAS domain S-box-containing protein